MPSDTAAAAPYTGIVNNVNCVYFDGHPTLIEQLYRQFLSSIRMLSVRLQIELAVGPTLLSPMRLLVAPSVAVAREIESLPQDMPGASLLALRYHLSMSVST